jgi:signal recognition particle subunit SRP54
MSSIPGLSGAMEGVSDEDAGSKLKRMIFIMDSMDNAELDSDGLIFVSVFGAFYKSENSIAFPNLEHA